MKQSALAVAEEEIAASALWRERRAELVSAEPRCGDERGARLRHRGDADVGGLLIWRLLRTRVGAPIELFRTTEAWVREQSAHGGQVLTARERAALHGLHEDFSAKPEPDFAQATALARAILDAGIKLEQERY